MEQDKIIAGKVACIICERFIEENKTFTCINCRRSSICLEHFDQEYKVCSGCATEKRLTLYNDLQRQEKSIKGFLRLTQFIFLLFAVLFACSKLIPDYIPEYIKGNIFFEYSFILAGISVIGIVLFFIFKSSHKSRLAELNEKIQDYRRFKKYSR